MAPLTSSHTRCKLGNLDNKELLLCCSDLLSLFSMTVIMLQDAVYVAENSFSVAESSNRFFFCQKRKALKTGDGCSFSFEAKHVNIKSCLSVLLLLQAHSQNAWMQLCLLWGFKASIFKTSFLKVIHNSTAQSELLIMETLIRCSESQTMVPISYFEIRCSNGFQWI